MRDILRWILHWLAVVPAPVVANLDVAIGDHAQTTIAVYARAKTMIAINDQAATRVTLSDRTKGL